ncbi:guanine nucleotide-binding protein subunit beta-like isoform X2 [Athalia rosae]|uniref:guanine nucleotide-binding protein subunit beta-like isoform X2 n=1 Tax=Athalia rosae TaxID=37344 RepID=UPI002033B51D|nr:guanine nucleotide-binding protein subunit beta-like isoform X2 [Athalia rosae]
MSDAAGTTERKNHHQRDAVQTRKPSKAATTSGAEANEDPETQLAGKVLVKEKQRAKGMSIVKQPNFYTDRRITAAEFQRRHTWLQKTRISVAQSKNRCRITNEVKFSETFKGLFSARFSSNGEVFAASFGTGAIQVTPPSFVPPSIWRTYISIKHLSILPFCQVRNGETAELKATLRSSMETSFPVVCCRFNPSRKDIFYASSACGNIFLCTTSTYEFSRFIAEPKNEINTIDVNLTGEHLVSAGKDTAIRLYDAENGKLITVYRKNAADLLEDKVNKYHRMRVYAAKFHHGQPDVFVTGGWDDTVRIWDSRASSGSVRVIKGPHICGDAIDIKDSRILTGSWVVSGSLQLWDMTSGKLIETINPQNRPTTLDGEFLYTVQFFDGDPYGETVLCGGSGTNAVEVVSLKDKKVVGSFQVNKAIVALDSNQTTIVFGGMESVIRIADYS